MIEDPRVDMIRNTLTRAFAPQRLEVRDDSHQHVGHAGAASGGGHYQVTIVAGAFTGKPLLERHRLVYAALNEALQQDIHALSIKAQAPGEA